MLKKSLNIGLLALLGSPWMSAAAPTPDFDAAYDAFEQALHTGENVQQHAQTAYEVGLSTFGETSPAVAKLAINYANAMAPSPTNAQQRATLYKQALTILEQQPNPDPLSLIDPLMGIAKSADKAHTVEKAIERAIDIAKQQQKPKLVADLKVDGAEIYFRRLDFDKGRAAVVYLNEAEAYYQAHIADDTVEMINVTMLLGAVDKARGRRHTAIERFNKVVNIFDDNFSFDHPAELQAHSQLVALYEQEGESEQATKHCVAIAKMRPWTKNQEQTPLYRTPPRYPAIAVRQRREGWVQMEFTVNESGFVEDVSVLDSDGSAAFERAAVNAVKQWRYAPKFENNQAVKAKTSVQLDFKIG